jgi:hypothetical protein
LASIDTLRRGLAVKEIAHSLSADKHHGLKFSPLRPRLHHSLSMCGGAHLNQRQGQCLVTSHLQRIHPRWRIACRSGDDDAHGWQLEV